MSGAIKTIYLHLYAGCGNELDVLYRSGTTHLVGTFCSVNSVPNVTYVFPALVNFPNDCFRIRLVGRIDNLKKNICRLI